MEGRQSGEYEAEGGDHDEETGDNGHHLDNETRMEHVLTRDKSVSIIEHLLCLSGEWNNQTCRL